MPDPEIRRWSRRIVHPRMTLTTDDPDATVQQLELALQDRGFRTTPADSGFRAKRRPWLDWLAAAAASPCVLLVEPTSGSSVVVDVEGTGNHPAPSRVAEALTDAVRRLADAGVQVRWDEWQAVP
jgi:hypothetical protein